MLLKTSNGYPQLNRVADADGNLMPNAASNVVSADLTHIFNLENALTAPFILDPGQQYLLLQWLLVLHCCKL